MRIDLIGVDCPDLPGTTVGLQRGSEVVDERPADGHDLQWSLVVDVVPEDGAGSQDFRGPYAHGRRGGRFVYLSWQRPPEGMFRRAKLMLDAVPPPPGPAEDAVLRAVVRLALPDGTPLCAAVRPPAVSWSWVGGDA